MPTWTMIFILVKAKPKKNESQKDLQYLLFHPNHEFLQLMIQNFLFNQAIMNTWKWNLFMNLLTSRDDKLQSIYE